MTANQVIIEIIGWLRKAITLMILALVVAVMARGLGFQIPLNMPNYTDMAYLAGAYWLTKS